MATNPTRICVAGAGRMGLAIISAAENHSDLDIASVWVRDPDTAGELSTPSGALISSNLEHVVDRADVIIDFSLPSATENVIRAAIQARKPLVCGVSGLDDAQSAAIDIAAAGIPLVYDRNMSQGIAVLQDLVQRTARSLGDDFAIEIHETHHIHKKDAPSGTALKLGEAVLRAKDSDNDDAIRYESERRGEVPGDHNVIFSSLTERLELRHSVTTRQVFAEGALRAARWVVAQPPGLYGMHDVLFDDGTG